MANPAGAVMGLTGFGVPGPRKGTGPMTETTPVERGDPSETATEALGAPMSRRDVLGKMSYVAPVIVALQVSKPGLGLGRSGAYGKGNTRIKQVNTSNQNQTVTQTTKQTVTQHVTLTQTNNQGNRGSR